MGGAGADTLVGGEGDDTLSDSTGVTKAEGGDGLDLVELDWSSLSGVSFSSAGLVAAGSGPKKSYSGTYHAKGRTGQIVASCNFSDIEKLLVNGKEVDLTPPPEPGVKVTRIGDATFTTERGGQVEYKVCLTARPFENVNLKFTSSDASEGKINTPKLTFTPLNWSAEQRLIIEGVDDYFNDSDVSYTVRAVADTRDLTYNRVGVPSLNLVNRDDGEDAPLVIQGTTAVDYIYGRNGDDRLYGNGNQDQLKGGIGNDKIYGDQDDDRLYGEAGDDKAYGGYDDDFCDGGSGNDSLFGEEGLDTLLGGAGDDYLDGGLENDSMVGGSGSDTYVIDSAQDVISDLGEGAEVDAVLVLQSMAFVLPFGIENAAVTGAGEGKLTGNALNNRLVGNDARNTLDGGAGNDTLEGGAGSDRIICGAGSDVVVSGAGDDTVLGGEGVDLLDFTASGIEVEVDLSRGTGLGDGADSLSGVENVFAGDGNDLLVGGVDSNWLIGGGGRDTLFGNSGNDTLTGCVCTAKGGRGEIDRLAGGVGMDFFTLGCSNGVLYDDGDNSGAGVADYALITDFEVGVDRLQLKGAARNYRLSKSEIPGVAGMALWSERGVHDELVAILRSANTAPLTLENTVGTALFI
jgi:Ca2+-binding RTX toxin-like protein